MADRIELALRPKTDAKPLDLETAKRIGRVARAVTVELDEGGARIRNLLQEPWVVLAAGEGWAQAAE